MPGTDTAAQDELEQAFRQTFPAHEYPNLPHFYCRGGFDFKKLSMPDKIAMRLFFKMEEKNDDEKTARMLADMRASFDETTREYLEPLIEHLGQGH